MTTTHSMVMESSKMGPGSDAADATAGAEGAEMDAAASETAKTGAASETAAEPTAEVSAAATAKAAVPTTTAAVPATTATTSCECRSRDRGGAEKDSRDRGRQEFALHRCLHARSDHAGFGRSRLAADVVWGDTEVLRDVAET
jgi:hypothetical protein